jgi:hypothetical protein
MSKQPVDDDRMPPQIDFSTGVHGLHQIPADAKVFLPASIERSVWEYFPARRSTRESICWSSVSLRQACAAALATPCERHGAVLF